jgi:rhodanese-related sulfurtransferase
VYGTASVCSGPVCPLPGAPREAAATASPGHAGFEVPEPIEPAQLAELLFDQPQNYAVLDVRPAWQFAEYHVPGATHVELDALQTHVDALPASTRVVLADRDGSVAWALAGALSARLDGRARSLRVISGGTARFWREVELPSGAPPAFEGARALPATAPAAVAPPPDKPAARKRSAGC